MLDPAKFEKAEQLDKECGAFSESIRQFAELVASLVEILERQAAAIEKVKLKAIGRRNLVDAEPERRRRLEAELAALVSEKIAEQERLQAEYDSLARVLADQEEVMERLTSADA